MKSQDKIFHLASIIASLKIFQLASPAKEEIQPVLDSSYKNDPKISRPKYEYKKSEHKKNR